MNYAVILAGGIGSRFWPLSRQVKPKQFLLAFQDKSMLEESISRTDSLINKKNIYIATNRMHSQKIKNYLKKFNITLRNILLEPVGKNTFAPIGLLTKRINDIDSNATIVVMPCDHFIKYRKRFLRLLNIAIGVAQQGYIVTLGISPTRAETGYGYIKIKSKINPSTMLRMTLKLSRMGQKSKIHKVDKFFEKPSLIMAKRYIKDKRYYWNSGIFIFRADIMLAEIKRYMPSIYKIIVKMENKRDFVQLWHKLPNISIDYAIMERSKKMALMPADFEWIDLGSWQAIEGLIKKDKNGNVFRGNCIDIGSKNILVWSDKRLLATLGLSNIIIVDTKDALLICAKDKTQDVKRIVQILKQKNFKKLI